MRARRERECAFVRILIVLAQSSPRPSVSSEVYAAAGVRVQTMGGSQSVEVPGGGSEGYHVLKVRCEAQLFQLRDVLAYCRVRVRSVADISHGPSTNHRLE